MLFWKSWNTSTANGEDKKGNLVMDDLLQINSMGLSSRIIMPPIGTYKCTDYGKVTEELLEYYAARARNPRVSMIITEHSYIAFQGKAKPRQLSVSEDSDIEGLQRLTEVIHAGGAKVICQLNHAGSSVMPGAGPEKMVAPSPVELPVNPPAGIGSLPEELTVDQISEIVEQFAAAAVRAKKAGYDGVEIHSAHAYLLNQFYSPLTNLRTDAYGGSLDARLRMHREVIAAVREAVGEEYPVAIRLGGCDYRDGGSTIEDCVYAARTFEQAGIDLIDLSGGMCRYTIPGHSEPGYFREMSEAVKAAVSVPVLLTGGVKTVEDAEKLLEEGAADLIGVGRELFKSATWGTNYT